MADIASSGRIRIGVLTASAGMVMTAALSAVAPAQAASGPGGVRAEHLASEGMGLTWQGSGEEAYRVRYATSPTMSGSDTWDVIGNHFELTHTDANPTISSPRLTPGQTYYVQVKSIRRVTTKSGRTDLSDYSSPVPITTPVDALPELEPVDLEATVGGADRLYVSWRTRGPGVSYLLRYTTNPAADIASWDSTPLDAAGGTVTGLTPDRTYYLRARVVGNDGQPLSGYSATVSKKTPAATTSPGVNVVSYNVRKASGSPSWTSRRQLVADGIRSQKPDIIALQEATPISTGGVKQYTDLMKLLNAAGSRYAYVTSATTSKSKEYSSGTQLAYDTARLVVKAKGVKILAKKGSARRYAVWSVLEDKVTGRRIFAITTHLEPGSSSSSTYNSVRTKQAKEVLALITSKNPLKHPVVLAGDMNSSRSTTPYNGPYRAYVAAGYVDPLDNAVGSWESGHQATAEHLVDAEYNSANVYERTARRATYPIGTNIDYLMTSPGVRVALWRTVVHVDANRQFVGTIPSDHNMLSATIHLP